MLGGQDNPDTLELFIVLGFCAAILLVFILFLLCLSQALSRCNPRYRTMSPGAVWLMLIPVFGMVWQFIVVNRIAESLSKEYRARGLRSHGDFGSGVGMAFCIFGVISLLPIPILDLVASLAVLVCFIMYWVKIGGYSAELARDGSPRDPDFREDEYADEYDDRPRRQDDEYDDRPRRRLRDDRE